jgi:nucleoside-diphosphate-sugar epimerase
MNTLIIGCGYLGRRVAARWLAQGHAVYATTRRPEGAEEWQRLGFRPVVCDILQPATLKTLPHVDALLFAVGFDRGAGVTMRDVYVGGLANVLAHLRPPRKFIYISSTSVYGQTDGSLVDETAPTAPEEEAGQIVLAAEGVLRTRLPDAVILRFAGIYGPGRLLRRQTIAAGEPIVGHADRWLNLIQVEDGATAVLAADEHGAAGQTYIVSDGLPVRRHDFYAELARVLGAPEPRFVAPPADAPLPPHERANRRLLNRKMLDQLRVVLRYPTYVDGLRASLSGSYAT